MFYDFVDQIKVDKEFNLYLLHFLSLPHLGSSTVYLVLTAALVLYMLLMGLVVQIVPDVIGRVLLEAIQSHQMRTAFRGY
jgi:hypothetical protein